MGYLRNKLPAPIASQIEGAIGGDGAGKRGGIGDVAKNIGVPETVLVPQICVASSGTGGVITGGGVVKACDHGPLR